MHFAQTELVNWTLVTDDSGVLVIDAGFPGQRDEVIDSVRQLGYGIDDIHAFLLTHAHVDHFGSAIWFAKPMAHRCSVMPPRWATRTASTWSRCPSGV